MKEKDTQMQVVEMAELAEKLEQEAKATSDADAGSYEHIFKEPWEHGKKVYTSLHFEWNTLTGGDSLAIEMELRRQGVTLVVPAFTGDYLAGMAARACVERKDESGTIVIRTADIKSMPMTDFLAITAQARNFLLREMV